MGWGRTLLLGDIGNRLDIADVEVDVAMLKRELAISHETDLSQDSVLQCLQKEVDELYLFSGFCGPTFLI